MLQRKLKRTFYVQQHFPHRLRDNIEKKGKAGESTDDNITRRISIARTHSHTHTHTHTLAICNNYCFSTATGFARTPLNVRLYVHCLACSFSNTAYSNFLQVL